MLRLSRFKIKQIKTIQDPILAESERIFKGKRIRKYNFFYIGTYTLCYNCYKLVWDLTWCKWVKMQPKLLS